MKDLAISSKLLEELMKMYMNLDFNNPDEIGKFIYKMTISEAFVSEKVGKRLAADLKNKGFTDYKEYEINHPYMDKYNNAVQYFFLEENKEEVAGNLLSRYISSLDFSGKSNVFVKYLAIIYRNRFLDSKDKNKIDVLRTTPTFNSYCKTLNKKI